MLSLRFPLDICEDRELVCESDVKLPLCLVVVNIEVAFKTNIGFLQKEEDQRLSSGCTNG